MTKATTQEIMAAPKNAAVIEEFFTGIASGQYYNGTCYQLYLDTSDNTLRINQEASDQSFLHRDDGSLVMIRKAGGYCDLSGDDLYTEGCNLDDYGFSFFLEEIENEIAEKINAA